MEQQVRELYEFTDEIARLVADAGQYENCMSLTVDEDGSAVELVLDNRVSTYGDWIKGEGADIHLLRCMKTDKVVGCRLPLMLNKLVVQHEGPIRINGGFKKPSGE